LSETAPFVLPAQLTIVALREGRKGYQQAAAAATAAATEQQQSSSSRRGSESSQQQEERRREQEHARARLPMCTSQIAEPELPIKKCEVIRPSQFLNAKSCTPWF